MKNEKAIKIRVTMLSCLLILSMLLTALAGSGNSGVDYPTPLGPPYEIDVYYVNDVITVDGNLSEPAWSDPSTTVTLTTETYNDWNLTIYVFHDSVSLYVGVELLGDTAENPNDLCELCFDVDHDGVTPPEATDMKISANSTNPIWNEYAMYYGNGTGWSVYSNEIGTPNPWPAGYAANASMQDNATYEFQVPISAAWGEAIPPDGNITGFEVHGFGQASNEHVWWPDNYYFGQNPAVEYCDDPSQYGDLIFHGSGDPPDHLEYVAGDDQVDIVGTTLPQMLQMRVHNQTHGNVSGVVVNYTFETVPGGATGYYFEESGTQWYDAVSDVNGIANATIHLGNRAGDYWINASNPLLLGLAGPTYNNTLNATALVGPADHLLTVSGGGDSAEMGQQVPPFWARVVDLYDNNISGAEVWWNITSVPVAATGQSLTNPTSVSDANGLVSTTLTLGDKVGWYNVTCENLTLTGVPNVLQFNSTAIDAVDHLEYASGDGQTDAVGTVIVPFRARVVDQLGFNVSGATVWWNFTDVPAGAAGHLLSNPTSVSNASGLVSTTLTLGDKPGWYNVTCESLTLPGTPKSIQFDTTATVGAPDTISYVSGNGQHNQTGDPLNEPFLVKVTDQFGNPVPNVDIDWAINGTPFGAMGQSMNPITNTTNATGIAGSFMMLGDQIGWYFINATNSTLDLTGEPVNFSAQAMPPPLHIAIVSGNGQSATAGTLLPQPLVVNVSYDDGSLVGAGISVWFNVTVGGGSVDTSPVLTNSSGLAHANLTLGPVPGTNNVTAHIGSTGTSSVVFTATGTLPQIYALKETNVTRILVGEIIDYTINYGNNGTESATNVWVNDTLSSNLIYVSDDSGVTPAVNGTAYSWFFPVVPTGPSSFNLTARISLSASNGTQISNNFTVDYSDETDRPMPLETSNTVVVTVISEPVVNIPPTIEGVPDLVVHWGWPYLFDLSPYITDPDTAPFNLYLIFSDAIHVSVDPANNLGMIINYPISYLGTNQTLIIAVSDGLGSDTDVINVQITEDFPPVIVENIPDVVLDEDTILYSFNITTYFWDPDGDALYYTYGERHVNITFLWNYTVRVTPDENWFGVERVTFRATDPTGALIEDTINITVRPVNDPPVISEIAGQSGEINVAWILDLSPYIQDIDNQISELIITTDSEFITVNGLNLTFRFLSAIDLDIITITVSDGEAQVYRQVNVTVTAPEVSTSPGIPPWIFIPIIIIIAALLAALFAYRRRKPTIEQAFLIYHDGTLLAHATNRMIPEMDSQIFSSMFTAIQDFIKDSFKDEKEWELNKLEFGENKIFLDKGVFGIVNLALVYKGKDAKVPDISKKVLEDIESKYGKTLTDWDGNLDNLRGSRDVLMRHIN